MDTSIPKHIAIIMDGNGRWAQAQNLPRIEGHIAGLQSVKRIVKACLKQGIAILSLFAFSSENWARPEEEVNGLMTLFLQTLQEEIQELNLNQVQLRFIGNLTQLPTTLQEYIKQAEQLTHKNQAITLNIAINYGGKWDIIQSVQKLMHKVLNKNLKITDISEAHLEAELATTGLADPDLFIRTSGEHRISNFFLWQLAYTELYFSQTYWPDFNEEHLDQAIQDFQKRQRRFGQLNPEF